MSVFYRQTSEPCQKLLDALLQRHQLESLKLQQSVRNSVQDAVESLGGRVTVGDVSARAGVKISEAEEALNALAADAAGTLEASMCLARVSILVYSAT